jgi:chemotaxis protein MotB
MKKLTFPGILILVCCTLGTISLQGQSKKDLIAEVQNLKTELDQTHTDLAQARKNEAVSNARVTGIEAELADLRATNTNLLANLNRITEESSKKTASISESLTNIQQTERQLRSISDALTRIDSTTLSIVTALKNTMGENAKIGISNNVVTVAVDNPTLFGEDDKSFLLDEGATAYLNKIADIMKKHPQVRLQVDSYANSLNYENGAPKDNLELSALRAVAVGRKLSSEMAIKENRITTTGNGIEGLSLETSTRFQIRPDYIAFFTSIKDNIKN